MTPAEYRATVTTVGRRLPPPKNAELLHIYEAISRKTEAPSRKDDAKG
jgi:hypothetical protein